MLPVSPGRRVLTLVFALAAAVLFANPTAAQTGMVKGRVVDAKDQPIAQAKVTIEFAGGVNRKYEVTTNKSGDYIQIGLPPGMYRVTAEKSGIGSQVIDTKVPLGDAAEANFKLVPGAGGGVSPEDAAKNLAIKGVFDLGVAASKAGNNDEAIAKFKEAAAMLAVKEKDGTVKDTCYDCYYNVGYAYAQKKEYAESEAAFKKALEIKPDYVDAYNGLATVYNAQKKFEDAQAASQKAVELAASAGGAGGGGSVDALYNQGVINWNAGKIPEAQKNFEDAIKLNPDHADSHYQLGMAMVNQGKLAEAVPEFETYLRLAPDGQYAAQAKGIVATLKK